MNDEALLALQTTGKIQRVPIGGGLYLEVSAAGTKFWRFRYRAGDKDTLLGLGKYSPTTNETDSAAKERHNAGFLTLAEAQEAAKACREAARLGQHPADYLKREQNAREATQTTFAKAAANWLEGKAPIWKKETFRQRKAQFEQYVLPSIGKSLIRHVTHNDVDNIISTVAKDKPSVAVVVRQALQQIFDDADRAGLLTKHPAFRPKRVAMPVTQHARHIDERDIGGLFLDMAAYPGTWQSRGLFRFCWLTLCRTNEALYTTWDEIDLAGKVWRIPASRMKMRRQHIVPLSEQALAVLTKAKAVGGGVGYVFKSPKNRNKAMGLGVLHKLLVSIKWCDKMSPHGIRGTASTIMYSAGNVRPEVIETLLAHSDRNSTRASYNHSDYLPERKRALQWWADLTNKKVKAERLKRAIDSGNQLEQWRAKAGLDFLADDGKQGEWVDVWLD